MLSFAVMFPVFVVVVSDLFENWNYDTSFMSLVSYNWSIDVEKFIEKKQNIVILFSEKHDTKTNKIDVEEDSAIF